MWQLVGVALLVLANAFFVAAEFGLVAVRRTRIDELVRQGNRQARTAKRAIAELNLMLSGVQLGITFASLGLGWIGEPALAHLFEGLFDGLPSGLATVATHGTAVALAFGIITALHVILGELVPKNLAIALPEKTALWVAPPLLAFTFAFRPIIWLFNEGANLILRLLGVRARPEIGVVHTPEELAIIIQESREGGTLAPRQSEILARALDFSGKRAVDVMAPRTAVHALHADAPLDDVLEVCRQTGYSRFPVWEDRPDEFVGAVHVKDVIAKDEERGELEVRDVMHEPLLVPESLPLDEVLRRIEGSGHHFAVVVDEFASTAGILTLEDIVEELLGEIRDEYHVREGVRSVAAGWRVPGSMRPDELRERTGCPLPEGEYETIAGFILDQLGRLARRGDEVTADGWRLRVAYVRRRRIVSVDVEPPVTLTSRTA